MWVKLDDRFTEHPKVLGLSDRAFRAYIESLCYSARYLTDGHLTPAYAERKPTETQELVAAGLWRQVRTGGYDIHDYLDWNPPASDVKARAADRAAAKRKGGQVRAANAERNPDGTYRTSRPASSQISAGSQGADAAGLLLGRGRVQNRRPQPAQPAVSQQGHEQATSPVPVPVPVPEEREAMVKGSLRVNDRQMYLLERLVRHDGRWATVTPGALVKLGKEYGMDAVTTALGFCREDFPDGVRSPYAYLRQVTAQIVRDRGGAV